MKRAQEGSDLGAALQSTDVGLGVRKTCRKDDVCSEL